MVVQGGMARRGAAVRCDMAMAMGMGDHEQVMKAGIQMPHLPP